MDKTEKALKGIADEAKEAYEDMAKLTERAKGQYEMSLGYLQSYVTAK